MSTKNKILLSAVILLNVTAVVWFALFPPAFWKGQSREETDPRPFAAAPSVTDIPREPAFGWDKRLSLSRYETFVFDDAGNQTGTYRYGADGEMDYYQEKTYDEHGSCTGEIYEFLTLGNGATEHAYRYEYDEAGRVLRKITYEGDAVSYVSDYRYEGENTFCATSFPEADGTVSSGYATVKNADGTTMLEYQYDALGNITSYQTAECDEKGRIIRRTVGHGTPDGEPMKELVTEWDDGTQTGTETLYEPAGHVNAVLQSSYTEGGNQISGIRYVSGYQGADASEWNQQLQFTEAYLAEYEGEQKQCEFRYAYQEISYYRLFLYDETGRCVTEAEYDNDDHAHAAYVYRCRYDDAGRLCERYTYRIESDISFTGEDGTVTSLEFDGDGHLSAVTREMADKTITHQYRFDGEGRLCSEEPWAPGILWKADGE